MHAHFLFTLLALSVASYGHSSAGERWEAGDRPDTPPLEDTPRYALSRPREPWPADSPEGTERALHPALIASQPLSHKLALDVVHGNYDAALAELNRSLTADRNNPELVAERAEVLSWKGDLARATEAYEELVRTAPMNGGYLLRLAQTYAAQGRMPQARASYRKLLLLDPENVEAWLGFARLYRDEHEFDRAERLLREGLVRFPADPRLPRELTELAAMRALSPRHLVQLIELGVFALALLAMAYDLRRERRIMRRRRLAERVLWPALLAFGLLIAVVYVDQLFGGAGYRELSIATQVLEPVALGLLLAVTLAWRLGFERPPRQQTILAIGAHPDDIEFGCGATVHRLREEGAATYGLVLTGGENGHGQADDSRMRVEEAHSGGRAMNLCDIEVHGFPDTLLHQHKAEVRALIEAALKRWRPDIIFTHNGHDAHTDHHTIFEATREAARGAYSILCYENPNTPPGFNPRLFYDVSHHIESKVAALACHKTQMGKAYVSPAVVRTMAGFRGTQARVPFAEGFEVMRILEKARKP